MSLFRTLSFVGVLVLSSTTTASAENGSIGDYGYRHMEYHKYGSIDALRRQKDGSMRSCCDNMGECRATNVNVKERKVFIDGQWCPIPPLVELREDVPLPDVDHDLVCAGKTYGRTCPTVYCVALRPKIN
ncbi:hypothetical protein EBR66_04310 [bacterium]|nr:hypothetical protein [bacterium]